MHSGKTLCLSVRVGGHVSGYIGVPPQSRGPEMLIVVAFPSVRGWDFVPMLGMGTLSC